MIRIWKRNPEEEEAFLNSSDISVCPKCGDLLEWDIRNTGDSIGTVRGRVCINCGWLCGTAKYRDLFYAIWYTKTFTIRKIFREIKRRLVIFKKNLFGEELILGCRRVGYLEQFIHGVKNYSSHRLPKKKEGDV